MDDQAQSLRRLARDCAAAAPPAVQRATTPSGAIVRVDAAGSSARPPRGTAWFGAIWRRLLRLKKIKQILREQE
jgi:hypothetical protein